MKTIKRFLLQLLAPLMFLAPVGTLVGQAPAPKSVEEPKTETVAQRFPHQVGANFYPSVLRATP